MRSLRHQAALFLEDPPATSKKKNDNSKIAPRRSKTQQANISTCSSLHLL